jgi:hypothetical protein
MASVTYSVVSRQDGGRGEHDGEMSGHYVTKEAAFEVAVGPAANAIKEGLGVTMRVPGTRPGRTASGVDARGASRSIPAAVSPAALRGPAWAICRLHGNRVIGADQRRFLRVNRRATNANALAANAMTPAA